MSKSLIVKPGAAAKLKERNTAADLGFEKDEGKEELQRLRDRLGELQERLYAEGKRSLVLVLQGLDASGKDGVIRSVFEGVNPQGCRVASFKAPTTTELGHDYLWRVHQQLPSRGEIGIFNRSHYEDVVAVRMHKLAPEDEGTTLVKVFLHVSREEQLNRFRQRLEDPTKQWKFRKDDLEVAERYDEYLSAWDDVISETSTDHAPWYVVPADRNWVKAMAVGDLLVRALEKLDPKFPDPEPGLNQVEIPR
jgi:polyphosphate kinase 2 (PPK2 family)